ncbi:hypothetical protein AJ79_07635 [Helicocarpus griseus UAMH5409]|uniref:DUF6891 domain-containing protein n=1 Tax=Helicocarpus griseus UAMH5409 TaxID=1447875 RepID=A0A2B7X0T5_9EURO|nr:hypothetical protein AJ79_07635 [Helicocarpus griseus UAMH5409]
MSQETQEHVRQMARWQVKSGFWTLTDLIDRAADAIDCEEDMSPVQAKRIARQIVIPLWEEQLTTQQSWAQEQTIAEKLERAFESLQRNHGIITRMNFACCRTCGVSEIGEDRDDEDETVGFAFFHEQTTEGFVEYPGSNIMVYYGTFPRSKVKAADVAGTVVRVLRRGRLSVEWNGETSRAIEVKCEEWRKRLMVQEGDSEEDDSDYDSEDEAEEDSEAEAEIAAGDEIELCDEELAGLVQEDSQTS